MRNARPLHTARRQAGFTLVELVTVIVILGVLAAVALPRYASLQTQARTAKVTAIAGSLKAAIGMAKAAAMANSVSCSAATGTSVTMEGTTVALNYCYPQALAMGGGGAFDAANVTTTDNWVMDGSHGGALAAGSVAQVNLSDAGTPANCSVSYTSAATATTPPVIATTVSGC